jgi:2-isopropylmalate synthase
MNLDIGEHEERLRPALNRIKKLENQGYEFEAAEASIRVLMETALNGEREFFAIDNFRVITDMHRTGEVTSEATVKIKVGDRSVHTVAEGMAPHMRWIGFPPAFNHP